jgi:Protein of unknown function (DUF4446)
VNDLTEPAGLVALAAGAVALLALIFALVLAVKLRRLRGAQQVVLGTGGRDDLVAHATNLQAAFETLHGRVEEVAERLDARMATAERRLDGAIAHRALVRYDAYGEMSGHQSVSLALLDADRNGVVLSCIAHRDNARLYCKVVADGRGEHELSPEEDEAIRLALAGEAAASHTVTLD